MNKRKKLSIKTMISSSFVLSAILSISAALYGADAIKEDSLSDSKKFKEKIERGLSLALEAINIAEDHKETEDIGHRNIPKADNKEDREFFDGDTDSNIEGNKQASAYRQVDTVHNRLIAEFDKVLNEKDIRKPQVSMPKPTHYTIKIPGNRPWKKTGIYLKKNDIVRIICKGKVMPGGFEMVYKNTSCQAEGYHFARGSFTILPDARYMAALGKVGNRDAFYIGSGREFVSYVNGHLYLGINDLCKSVYTGEPVNKRSIYWKDNTGGFEADIYVHRK